MRYTTIYDSEDQFQLARGAVITARSACFEAWKIATDVDEKAFYLKQVSAFDVLIAKYDAELARDTSQDAAPDSDDEDES